MSSNTRYFLPSSRPIYGVDVERRLMSSNTRYFLPSSRPIYGVDVESCALLKDWLSDRSQMVKVGDAFSNWESVKQGIPLGSVLGPILIIIL